jgi:hypothetical protein
MHPRFEKADRLSHEVIGAAIEVHRIRKLLDGPLGLVFNFPEIRLIEGLSRLILPAANQP